MSQIFAIDMVKLYVLCRKIGPKLEKKVVEIFSTFSTNVDSLGAKCHLRSYYSTPISTSLWIPLGIGL